jgi:hypothetical protein
MRKGVRWLLAGLTVLALATGAFGQTDWNLTGKGARAAGMGGAFIGIADDATAISWNPAGLAQLDRPELSTVLKFENLSIKWDPKKFSWNGVPGYHWNVTGANQSHFVVNFISGVLPLKVKERNLAFAVAYQQQLDFFRSAGDSTYKEVQTGGAYTISPGLAYQITPQFALGAAYNIWTGSSNYEYEDKINDINNSDSSYTMKEPYSGKNFFFGAWANVKPVKFGAILRTPTTLTYHREYSGIGNPYTPNTRRPVSGDWKQKMPMMYGFGMAVEPHPSFTLSADLDIRPYSNMEVLDSTGTVDTSFHFKSVTQLRFGAEYLAMLGQAILPLRIGFRTDPKTFTGWNYISRTPYVYQSDDKQVVGKVFTFGNGVAFKKFQLDEAFELAMISQSHDYNAVFGYSPSQMHRKYTSLRWLISGIIRF